MSAAPFPHSEDRRNTAPEGIEAFLDTDNFLSLLEIFPESIIISDGDGTIVYANSETDRLFGYTREEMLGNSVDMLVPENEREKHIAHRTGFYRSPASRAMGEPSREFHAQRKDGNIFQVEISLKAVNTEPGGILVLSSIRDVTERVSNHKTMLNITRGTFSRTGEPFFKQLAKMLGEELTADFITIGALQPDRTYIETIAFLEDGKLADNIVYSMKNTPCETTINDSLCVLTEGAQEQYPKDILLQDMGVQAYVGVKLQNSRGRITGLVNTLYRRPISQAEADRNRFLLQLFSLRISSELERIETETALRKSEYGFKKVFNNSPFGMLILDPAGRVLQANRSFYFMTRHKKADVLERPVTDIFPGEDAEIIERYMSDLIKDRISNFKYETNLLRGQGDKLDVCVYGYDFKDENRELQNVVLQIENISQKKKNEEEVKKLSQSVELSPQAIMITDKNAVIEYVNPKFCELTGHRKNECIGAKPDLISSGIINDDVHKSMWENVLDGRYWEGELKHRRKDGSTYWARSTLFPIFDNRDDISNYVCIHEDITESKKLSQQLSYRATHDELTGLLNRHEFERRMEYALEVAKMDGTIHSLCFLDLDQFKVINDSSGHIAGDALLRQLSKLLRNNVRSNDTIARLGGDEFGILMENCELSKAHEIAADLHRTIENFNFLWEDKVHNIGASIGITTISGNLHDTVEIMKQVDTACYAAKDAGRNRIHTYSDDDEVLTQHRSETNWVPEISAALLEDRFELFAQPIIPLHSITGRYSYEILIRLFGTRGEMIAPGMFLPSAERYNLSTRIDRYVIDKLFGWLTDNPGVLETVDHFAVNLSGASINNNELFQHIMQAFDDSGIAPHKIRFELTETSAIANIFEARSFMQQFNKLGCSIALDDFGSGLSSFAYLKNLPVDVLKIDGMFITDLVNDSTDYAMVSMINKLAHALGMKTIAEYVESEEIIAQLERIGVDYAQGYYYGRPRSIHDIFNTFADLRLRN